MTTKINNFWDLTAWQKGHSLVLNTYRLVKRFPQSERFNLIQQMQKASSSVTANLAEGFERYHFKDKKRFYYQARGSSA